MKSVISRMSRIIFSFMIIPFLVADCAQENVIPKSPYNHTIASTNGLSPLWSLNNIYTVQSDFESQMGASAGLVCILGDVVYPPKEGLSCIDGLTGKTAWQRYIGTSTAILAISNGIYVTYGGRSGIEKYDLSGKLLWSHGFSGTGVVYIYPYQNQIQLFMDPERFLVLDSNTGESIEDLNGNEVIFSTTTERFVLSFGIESRSRDLNQVNWHTENRDMLNIGGIIAPVFSDRFVFYRTGSVLGTLLAIDRGTGQVAWKTENNVVSNVIELPNKNKVAYLTRDGKLLAVDENNGSQNVLAEFSSAPFMLNGDIVAGGYELALDQSNGILFVLLGDSRQLFAFKVSN